MIASRVAVPVSAVFLLSMVGCKSGADPEPSAAVDKASVGSKEAPKGDTKAAEQGGKAMPETVVKASPGVIVTDAGEVRVTPLQHGSLTLTWEGRVIQIDPVAKALGAATGGKADTVPKADLILITHIHGDHFDAATIKLLRKEGAKVIVPASVAKKGGEALPEPMILGNGEKVKVLGGAVEVEAFPMYNLVRKNEAGEFFHPKGRGNGYVIRVGGKTIYISGDTECTPEMKALTGVDAAFVCMNLPYTMTVEEAAGCVKAFRPKAFYPYHHRGQDPKKLEGLLAGVEDVQLHLLEWYPAP